MDKQYRKQFEMCQSEYKVMNFLAKKAIMSKFALKHVKRLMTQYFDLERLMMIVEENDRYLINLVDTKDKLRLKMLLMEGVKLEDIMVDMEQCVNMVVSELREKGWQYMCKMGRHTERDEQYWDKQFKKMFQLEEIQVY